jgi:hypothetical protein
MNVDDGSMICSLYFSTSKVESGYYSSASK